MLMENAAATRRTLLKAGAASLATLVAAPALIRSGLAQDADLAPYRGARIDWRQAAGEAITVAVIPASYFDNLIAVAPQFEALTGVTVRFEKIRRRRSGRRRDRPHVEDGTYATHAADPMYYALYAANRWVEPLEPTSRSQLTDPGLVQGRRHRAGLARREHDRRQALGVPYDGEVTLQVLRKDLYDAKSLKPADTLEQFVANAAALHDPNNRVWGTRCAASRAQARNVYSTRPLFREFGGDWLKGGKLSVNGPEAEADARLVLSILMRKFAPAAARTGTGPTSRRLLARARSRATSTRIPRPRSVNNPEKSKVIGKVAYARWPKGPSGKRVSSIWNWGFPSNAALPEKRKKATWLFIQWAASAETQARTAHLFTGPAKRSGVNRTSLWKDSGYVDLMRKFGDNFVEATLASLEQDTDVDWRPRVPQWPAIGDTLATAIQSALAGQANVKTALDEAQKRIEPMMRG
jgi:multiple sugar transport system substrate-binding protein